MYEHAIEFLQAQARKLSYLARDHELEAEHGPYEVKMHRQAQAEGCRTRLEDCLAAASVLEALQRGREAQDAAAGAKGA